MEDSTAITKNIESMERSLTTIAIEAWRFGKVFERVLLKLDAGEEKRYVGQLRWFVKKVEESMAEAELRIVNVEGHVFDPGIPATPLNIEDFDSEDSLVIDQMIEPIIIGEDGGIRRTGTITLRKVGS